MKNKELFSENKIKKSTIKYFIISFSVFIVLLAVCSVVLFMHSLDFDISNLVDSSSTTTTEPVDENVSNVHSVNDLTGKSDLLFIVENIDGVDFICTVSTDFDNKSMRVLCVDGSKNLSYEGKILKISSIYIEDNVPGVKKMLVDNYGITIDKYVIFDSDGLKEMLSMFDGFSVNVIENVNYKSNDFNLALSSGIQELSPDMTYRFLLPIMLKTLKNCLRHLLICVKLIFQLLIILRRLIDYLLTVMQMINFIPKFIIKVINREKIYSNNRCSIVSCNFILCVQ